MGVSGSETEECITSDPDKITGYELTGCCRAMFANRISYVLDLKGNNFNLLLECFSVIFLFIKQLLNYNMKTEFETWYLKKKNSNHSETDTTDSKAQTYTSSYHKHLSHVHTHTQKILGVSYSTSMTFKPHVSNLKNLT